MAPQVSRGRATAALIALSLAAFAYVTTELLPIGLLTLIAADLDRSRSEVGLLVTGYAVVVVLTSLPLTHVTRAVPRRHLLAATLAVFTAATVVSALAGGYWVLVAARLVTAVTQALFWSVVGPTVAGLFPPSVRGRVVARFSVGPALAPVLGVPAGTWLGQLAGWRTAFLAMAGLALATGVVVTLLVPAFHPADGGAARGTAPDRRRYRTLLVVTAVGITGYLTWQTYVTPFLLDVSGFAESALSALLFVSGAAGVVGTLLIGRVLDLRPAIAQAAPLALVTASLLLLYALGPVQPVTVALLAAGGFAYSAFAASVQGRTLQVAPGNTDLASAGSGSAFNVGIALGSLAGGALLPAAGPRTLALAGGLVALAGLAVAVADARRGAGPAPAGAPTVGRQGGPRTPVQGGTGPGGGHGRL